MEILASLRKRHVIGGSISSLPWKEEPKLTPLSKEPFGLRTSRIFEPQISTMACIQELPTLFDLECALRRVRNGKATGEDDIPSEACGAHPVAMAKLLYPQLLKLALHGQEALIHKGGRLAVAHKKGPTYECSSSSLAAGVFSCWKVDPPGTQTTSAVPIHHVFAISAGWRKTSYSCQLWCAHGPLTFESLRWSGTVGQFGVLGL